MENLFTRSKLKCFSANSLTAFDQINQELSGTSNILVYLDDAESYMAGLFKKILPRAVLMAMDLSVQEIVLADNLEKESIVEVSNNDDEADKYPTKPVFSGNGKLFH